MRTRTIQTISKWLCGLAVISLWGCEGALEFAGESRVEGPHSHHRSGGATPGGDGNGLPTPGSIDACQSAPTVVGPAPMLRLTQTEYANTVEALFGEMSFDVTEGFLSDEHIDAFKANASAPVTELQAEKYMERAEEIAGEVVSTRLGQVVPCPQGEARRGCMQEFLQGSGAAEIWRRPLEQREQQELIALYDMGAQDNHRRGVEMVLQAMLMSSSFLYRIEQGSATPSPEMDNGLLLGDLELANRLSYFLWQSPPDAQLLAVAEQGRLHEPQELERQTRRMLEDRRARATMLDFHKQWLGLEELEHISKDEELFPSFNPELAESMRVETETFLDRVVWEGDGKLQTLLTADFSYVNAPLAELYGVEAPAEPWSKVQLPAGQRKGILTHASLLAMHAYYDQSSPVHRGMFVSQRMLCQQPPPTPPGLQVEAPEIVEGSTTRERFAQHQNDPVCAGCHKFMDSIGLGFENYDAIGRYRQMDAGQVVDSSGAVFFVDNPDVGVDFQNVNELTDLLGRREEVSSCYTQHWFRFAFGRVEQRQDACAIKAIHQRFEESGGDIRELIVALTTSPIFRSRPRPQ